MFALRTMFLIYKENANIVMINVNQLFDHLESKLTLIFTSFDIFKLHIFVTLQK